MNVRTALLGRLTMGLACSISFAGSAGLLAGSAAQAENFSWNFQRTGFRSTQSAPQTALSMRGDLSWPVVYGIDAGMLNAYSLFPVLNTRPLIGPPTNWHQIGANLTGSPVTFPSANLQAASGSPDGFAVSLQTTATSIPPDVVVVGSSSGGFQSPMSGAQAVEFRANGSPYVAGPGTIPGVQPTQKIFDVALSKFGDTGAIVQSSSGTGTLTFWQQSPLLGGAWLSSPLNVTQNDGVLAGGTVDLVYDSSARPHVVGVSRLSPANSVMAQRFDITTGLWTASTLDTVTIGGAPIADVAAASNDHGMVGAAWVNNGTLKYAYMNTNAPTPSWTTTTVAAATPTGVLLELAQGVGLAFDKTGLPVISFVDRTSRQIWIAYDPPLLAPPVFTEGDFNGDGLVDGADAEQWRVGFDSDTGIGDANGDGRTDGADFVAWQRNLGAGANPADPAAAAVPEPASFSLSLVVAAVVLGAKRRAAARSHRILTSSV
ncbi:MAG TPA: hypothetical protein VEQ85_05765 [Lacipirellulaceae bacterium]|nr:hypothetical protein [Lacipirellulaceae bacterium]